MRSPSRLVTSGSNNFEPTNYVSYEEENFISYLRELLDLENQLEKAKCDNIIRSDFNAEDAFSIFEVDRRGYLTELDLKYGLNALDIFPTQEEIALLVKRYESRGEGILTYNDFFDMLTPVDMHYRRMLESRIPSLYGSRRYKADVFLNSTKATFNEFLRFVLNVESKLEVLRQRLNRMVRFNIRTIFERIDRLGKGWTSDTDVINFIKFIFI